MHFGFLRASFEAHKQQMLDLTEEHKGLRRYPKVAAIENPR